MMAMPWGNANPARVLPALPRRRLVASPLPETPMQRLLATLAFAVMMAAAPAIAADGPAATLAGILVDMNHFPSDAEKETLAGIAGDDSVDDHLQAIASAIAGIEHTPSAAAQAELNGILASEAASQAQKTLAGAVLRFRHQVSVEDRSALEDLARRSSRHTKSRRSG